MVDAQTECNNRTALFSIRGLIKHMQHAADANSKVPAPLKIGYLVSVFPTQTHIIFWREITLLREMGAELVLYSTRRPPPGPSPHEFAAQAQAETHYVFPPPLLRCSLTLASRPLGASAHCDIWRLSTSRRSESESKGSA